MTTWKDAIGWDAGVHADTVSRDGALVVGAGDDFVSAAGLSHYLRTGNTVPSAVAMRDTVGFLLDANTRVGSSLLAATPGPNQKVRSRVLVEASTLMAPAPACRCAAGTDLYAAYIYSGTLYILKATADVWSFIASVAAPQTAGTAIDLEIEADGTTITARDLTHVVSCSAVDAALASGLIGFYSYNSQSLVFITLTADHLYCYDGTLVGTWTSPVVDGAVNGFRWLLSWAETLGTSCDVTVDCDADDNAANLFAGLEQTGLTDPNGIRLERTGRYAQVRVHLTRTAGAEAKVSTLTIAPTAISAGGAGNFSPHF